MKIPFFTNQTLTLLFILSVAGTACAQNNNNGMQPEETEVWEPVPPIVAPGDAFVEAPDDAIVLFDGTDLSAWESANDGDAEWAVENGAFTVVPGTGDIKTKDTFGSVQLYLEWKSPDQIDGDGQGRGNSGVFLQSRYEVQVLDSYENETYVNGMAGSIYKQHPPLANAAKPRGEWQSYNIVFEAPEFNDDGSVETPGYVTVFWNGVLVQHKTELQGPTVYIGHPEYEAHGNDSIVLQDHSDRVSYRNIWLRELD
ncbi:MAG: DUF1080 domain-containing protein [Balneolaceae bacterium]